RIARKNASRTKAKASGTVGKSGSSRSTKQANRKKDSTCPIVGIGGSAGGFEATMGLLKELPSEKGMAFVIVQDLDPRDASRLPILLSRATQMSVLEISKQMKPEPNTVYVLPSNKGLIYKNDALTLTKLPDRPTLAIDHFFASLAEEQGPRTIGIVLSGTG